jgi:hypothetical protein
MARYHDRDVSVLFRLDHGHHHELSMPNDQNLRVLGKKFRAGVRRIAQHTARAKDEPNVKLGKRTA